MTDLPPHTIVVIAPAPLIQIAMIVVGRECRRLAYPIADPEHYLACCAERARAEREEGRDG